MNEEINEAMETGAQEQDMDKLWGEEDGTEMTGQDEKGGGAEGETSPQAADRPGEVEGETSKQPTGEKAGEKKTETGEETTRQPESFVLRHLDDPPLTVDREGVVRLAQQGLDYERVRTERDQLREYRSQADPALNVLKAFAEKSGMTLEEYIDFCRVQTIMEGGVNENTAKAQVEMEKQKAQLDARQRSEQEVQKAQQEAQRRAAARAQAQRRDMVAFLEAYPEVKAEEVPREVWEKVAAGESLVSAYTMYQNRQLRAKIAAREQNRENAGKAPGSMKTQGEKGRKSLSEYWDETEE